MNYDEQRPIEVLLVEDSPSDAELTLAALEDSKLRNHITTVEDGVEALKFLRQHGRFAGAPRPDLILLDLYLPRMHGREVLAEIKADKNLCAIPVVVLTASRDEEDILRSYQLQASCYITKPLDIDKFLEVVLRVKAFWLHVVALPSDLAGILAEEPPVRVAAA
jgi:two-component system, chemotaxis family, response regulator Rcp1